MVYQWRKGAISKGADAQKVGEEINNLKIITPENFIKMAENKKTESYKTITWDNNEAAGKYRLYEARQVIGSIIKIEIIEEKNSLIEEEKTVFYKAFENIELEEGGRVYLPVEIIVNDDYLREKLFSEIKSMINDLYKKLDKYKSLLKEGFKEEQKQFFKSHIDNVQKYIEREDNFLNV